MKTLKNLLTLIVLGMMCSCAQQGGAKDAENEENAVSNDSAAVINTIMSRRSIRQYKDCPVEREKLELIVNCGINAPSGGNSQPWQIRVVDDKEYIDSITALFKQSQPQMASDPSFKNMFRNAPAVIFICSPKNGSGQLDCGLLGENIILAAQSIGLGTCCLGGPINFMKTNSEASKYVEKLQIPQDYDLLYAIGVGYPDENPEAKPRDNTKVMFIE